MLPRLKHLLNLFISVNLLKMSTQWNSSCLCLSHCHLSTSSAWHRTDGWPARPSCRCPSDISFYPKNTLPLLSCSISSLSQLQLSVTPVMNNSTVTSSHSLIPSRHKVNMPHSNFEQIITYVCGSIRKYFMMNQWKIEYPKCIQAFKIIPLLEFGL